MTETPAANTMHTTVYSHDGFKLNIVLAIASTADIASRLDEIRALGLTPNLPGLEPGQEKEVIKTVIRRQSERGTPIIDFYTDWMYEGKFGEHKYAHMYLDEDDIAEFEAQSGLKFADLPLCDSQTPIKRKFGQRNKYEVDVKRSFEIVKTPDGQHDNGMPRYRYSYAAPAPSSPSLVTGKGAGDGEDVNPFLSEDTQLIIRTALAAAKMDKNGAYEYILAYALPNRAIKKFSDAHPRLTVEQLITRITELSAEYHKKPAPVADQSAAAPAAQSAMSDPLRGEMIEITAVEPRTGKRGQWTAHMQFENQPIRFTLYSEDKHAIDRVGYDTTQWNTPDGQRYLVEGISVITALTEQGRKLVSVWDHKHKRLVEVRPSASPAALPMIRIPANKVQKGDVIAHVDGCKTVDFAIPLNDSETRVRYILKNGEPSEGLATAAFSVDIISGPSFDAATKAAQTA